MIRISATRYGRGLLAAMLVLGTPAMAQDAPPPMAPPQNRVAVPPAAGKLANPQPDHPAYSDLIIAIEGAVDKEVVLGNAMAVVGQQLRADPNVGAAEAVSPGLVDEILAGMRPVIDRHNDRVTKDYRPRMMAVMADYLTPEEASGVAAFYRSDLGRKLMSGVISNYNMESVIAAGMKEQQVTEAQVRGDITEAVTKGMAQMDKSDIEAIGREALANPALLKLQRISPQINRLRTQMENEPLSPADDAEIVAVVEAVFAKRFPQ
ncbi:DUF2059 domain-containing protein [Erythrobacter donghaensis]|uniref:DUF2059 domain-containing protein n=1 Tax=Erythrobacter donghaensis TaxID=267135 RepID=UPI000A39C0E0|nr:DUF2059 domain-containing protein [Erythrobacter donghaensis]